MPDDDTLTLRAKELNRLLPEYCKRLKKREMTKEVIFQEYLKKCPDPYSRSQFMYRFKAYQIMTNPVAHIEHKAGDKMFVDYAGDKLQCLVNRETGEITPPEIFVAILPCSSLTYVEAQMSQKKEDFIAGCENALRFYGDTPAAIVPDNLKAAVTRHGKKTTILTSQVPVKDWYEVIGDKTVADAILDRLVHNALRIELKGESLRKLMETK